MYRNSTQTNMFSFFFFFKCPNTTFFNEFLNSPHESATYVHNEFFVIRYSNLLPFVTHVVVFFVILTHTKHKLRAGRGFVFSGLHTLQLVSLCGVRRPLLCLCVRTSVVGCVFRFLHVVQNMSPSWQFYISRRGWFESGTRAGSRLVFTLGKKKDGSPWGGRSRVEERGS